tara:strand:+ start:349581 stop:350714 length:1134 start_codon:yes stop_codon:yes gene_type:complete
MKIAIIHYWFITRRGGEKVIESLLKIYPKADVYTLFYNKKEYGNYLENQNVYSSILNTSFLRKHYQKIFPLYPLGVRSLKLKDEYDLIISSESGPVKGIKITNNAPHVCYVHSPMRYCWSHKEMYVRAVNPILRPAMRFFLNRLRLYDKSTINNVDLYIANSKNVMERVANFYGKRAEVVYPPIADALFQKKINLKENSDFYLSFGAITPYKKIDLLVDTFNKNGRKLIIVGSGSEKKKLTRIANKNIVFKGNLDWEEIEELIYQSKALLFPGEEDFGMIPLELMAYGLPVIAFKKGGVLETVIENKEDIEKSSGVFFEEQTIQSLQDAIDYFENIENQLNPEWIKHQAQKFSESQFLKNFNKKIERFLKENSSFEN